jgi:hypothetical protein
VPDLFEDIKIVVDRSDLETCASCPMQMRLKRDTKNVVGHIAHVGEACHVAISQTIQHYIDSVDGGEILRAGDIAERIDLNLRHARPDVQVDAIEACKPSVWAIARTLHETDPDNILRFDGGQGKRCGQLSWESSDGIVVTTEFDLLRATESIQVLREDDWKGGWKQHGISDVAKSFQFNLHAVLAFENYPDVQRLDVHVWDLRRSGYEPPSVQFYRRKLDQYRALIETAGHIYIDNDQIPLEKVAAWPAVEKCRICDVSVNCPVAEREVAADPVARAVQFVALEAKYEAIKTLLMADIEKNGGRPIETPSGDKVEFSFTDKPKRTFKLKSAKESK